MGAEGLQVILKTQVETKMFKMYKDVVDHDRAYYGTNPYSGSWANTPDVRVLSDPHPERKWTKKKYQDVWEWLWDNTEKWENANAVKSPKGYMVFCLSAT